MKYGDVSLGQIEAVINKIGGVEMLRKLLSGKLVVVPIELVVLLVPDGSYSPEELPLGDPFVHYLEHGRFYFWHGFQHEIVPAAKSVRKMIKIGKVPRFKMAINATGAGLLLKFPNAVWEATDFLSWLEIKVEKMAKDDQKELLADGGRDHFLVKGMGDKVYVVGVRWRPDSAKCDLYLEELGYELEAGNTFAARN